MPLTKAEAKSLAKETKTLIGEVEKGETAHAAWVAIQDRVQQLYEGRNQREVAALVGKTHTWVADILHWDSGNSSFQTPFARDAKPGRREGVERAGAKAVLRDPENRKAVLDELTEEERAAVVRDADESRARTHERVTASERREDERKRSDHTQQFISAGAHLGEAKRHLRLATEEGRDVEFPVEEQQLLAERLDEVRREADVAELAIAHTTEIDWDAEWAKDRTVRGGENT